MAIPAINFKSLNKRQQTAILIGAPCALLIVLGWLTNKSLGQLGPDPKVPTFLHREQPDNVWSQINTTVDQIREKDNIIAEGPKIEATLQALQDDIKEAEQRLPAEAEKGEMRQLIERLAREIPPDVGTVHFKSVKIAESGKAGGRQSSDYQTITYQTEVEGDLNGIIKYIDQIEKNPRFMTIKAFTLKPGDMTVSEAKDKIIYHLHSVAMDVVTYVYTPQKGKGK